MAKSEIKPASNEQREYTITAKVDTFNGELHRVFFTNGKAVTTDRHAAVECFYDGCAVGVDGREWKRGEPLF